MPVNRERAQAELAAAVAVLSATYECESGTLSKEDFLSVVGSLAAELWPEQPLNLSLAVSHLGLRMASMLAEATGRPVADVLAEIGAEVAEIG